MVAALRRIRKGRFGRHLHAYEDDTAVLLRMLADHPVLGKGEGTTDEESSPLFYTIGIRLTSPL